MARRLGLAIGVGPGPRLEEVCKSASLQGCAGMDQQRTKKIDIEIDLDFDFDFDLERAWI